MDELIVQLGCEVVVEASQESELRELAVCCERRLHSTRRLHDERRGGVDHASDEHRVDVSCMRDYDGVSLAEVEVTWLKTRLFLQLAHCRVVRPLGSGLVASSAEVFPEAGVPRLAQNDAVLANHQDARARVGGPWLRW